MWSWLYIYTHRYRAVYQHNDCYLSPRVLHVFRSCFSLIPSHSHRGRSFIQLVDFPVFLQWTLCHLVLRCSRCFSLSKGHILNSVTGWPKVLYIYSLGLCCAFTCPSAWFCHSALLSTESLVWNVFPAGERREEEGEYAVPVQVDFGRPERPNANATLPIMRIAIHYAHVVCIMQYFKRAHTALTLHIPWLVPTNGSEFLPAILFISSCIGTILYCTYMACPTAKSMLS